MFYSDRQSALATLKLETGCVDCGYNAHPQALDFDHVRGEKVRNLAKMWSYSIESVLEEVEKCDVVCANCHRIRTADRLAAAL